MSQEQVTQLNYAQPPQQYGGAPAEYPGFGGDAAHPGHPLTQSQVIEQKMSTSQVLEGTGNYAAAGYGEADGNAVQHAGAPAEGVADDPISEVDVDELIEGEEDTGKNFRPPTNPPPRR